jgi:hypothetical protein
MSALGPKPDGSGAAFQCRAAATSEFNLLGQFERVVEFHAQVANRCLQLCVSKQELAGPQIACPLVNQGDLRPAQTVGAEKRVIEPGKIQPIVEQSRVLAGGHGLSRFASAREEPVAIPLGPNSKPPQHRLPGCFHQLEDNGSACLALHDGGSGPDAARQNHVSDAEVHKIAASQLAVDREIEQREIAYAVLVSELGPDCPDIFRFERRFGADQKPRVPRVPDVSG